MTRSISVKDEIFNLFDTYKSATSDITEQRMTNDQFMEFLINGFFLKNSIEGYLKERQVIIDKINKPNNGGTTK